MALKVLSRDSLRSQKSFADVYQNKLGKSIPPPSSSVVSQKFGEEQKTKQRLAALIQGGAPTEEIVKTVLMNNPRFHTLSAKRKQIMIDRITVNMKPYLERKYS